MSSTGFPTRLVSRPARLGCSSDLTALPRASRSSMVISEASCSDNFHPVRLGAPERTSKLGPSSCLRSATTTGVGSFAEFPKSHGPSRLDRTRRWPPQRFPASRRRHARPEFHVIRRAKNIGYGLFACSHDEARAFDQARPEQVMLQVSDGLSVRAYREALGHRA